MTDSFTLTLSCPNRTGIVHAVSGYLLKYGCDIGQHQQFDDSLSNLLFMRTQVTAPLDIDLEAVSRGFESVAAEFQMSYQFNDRQSARMLVMVSKLGHCLNDLIFRWKAGSLGAEIVAVVSNHEDLRSMAETAGLPFVHVPVTPETKASAEIRLLQLVDEYDAELVVLARYMQILSDETCKELYGRAINIHHSFLPGFKGAKPYHQAYERGVKLVGATAHYVTSALDEGPIIEQEVIRIDHTYDPRALQTVGRDAEAQALSRAVRWHCERRVLLNGQSTVVFQ
ncbi:formyltetrahydrofolate deformylase [Streptomyces sp. NBC_00258]|uniref:formyltetrahydrofolate deformylase n=1 Tax=Streptomyces sp. NBC_00258 TaxID=2903642 RepID=UPI002E294026|nr:formyltetrahydrofolate deformylase [Streptomyces sp. NBC_00258]